MKYINWLNKNATSLKDKTVAISGATGGIGVKLCNYLAHLDANIILLDRNAKKSIDLISVLKTKYINLNAEHITLDLENFDMVKSVTDKLKNCDIDYLIFNAGAYKIPRCICDTGYNNVFQINFVSPYYLARELMPQITSRGGRIVAVSSIAHNYSKIDTDDIDFTNKNAASKVYGNAKRFLTFGLFELFMGDKTLSIVHPGITFTNITNHYPKLIFAIIKHPMKIIFMRPEKAALNIIYGIFNGCNKNEWIGPRFLNVWGLPKLQKLHTCSFEEEKKINDISNKIFNEL